MEMFIETTGEELSCVHSHFRAWNSYIRIYKVTLNILYICNRSSVKIFYYTTFMYMQN